MIINCYNLELVPFIFSLIGIIGKFGLFPSNPGILGIVDGISLFSTIVLLVLNKYIYLIILGLNILPYLGNILLKDLCSGLLVILSLITIYHGISLNLRNFTLFITKNCYLILIGGLLINFFPFMPTGNFFNNWNSILILIPVSLLLKVFYDGK